MPGNWPVRFLGEGVAVTPPPYPTTFLSTGPSGREDTTAIGGGSGIGMLSLCDVAP